MSHTALPIALSAFRSAIEPFTLSQLHAELLRLQNSIYHLQRSNIALTEFPDEPTCVEAIAENEEVIKRQLERIQAVRDEMAKRGVVEGVEGHAEERRHDVGEREMVGQRGEMINGLGDTERGNQDQGEMVNGDGGLTSRGEAREDQGNARAIAAEGAVVAVTTQTVTAATTQPLRQVGDAGDDDGGIYL